MQSIGEILSKRPELKGNFDEIVAETMKNPEVQAFIEQNKMSSDQVQRSYSKFYEYVREKNKFDGKGYEPQLIMNQGYADVSYQTTEELAKRQEKLNLLRRVEMIGLPESLKNVSWSDIDVKTDAKRLPVIQQIFEFIQNPTRKGTYIYGDFGVGKSYLMAAMANELAQKSISTTLIHYPTFVAEIDFDNVKFMVNDVKNAQVLVLDDIGAEMNNAWLRDSVLQVILQHRMQENLPTFFTSNFRMEELEQHLAETKKVSDIWPAKRVMERIKYLAKEIRLEGVNRRHE